ncbi:MAG: hypothetical protein WBD03_05455 [Thermoplasmata archaeon]
MRKEFESGLAKSIAGKKAEKRVLGKAFMALVLGAVLLAGSALTVAAWQNQGADALGIQDQIRDPEVCDCDATEIASDGVCDCPCDGICDCPCDDICDCPCDGICDCPCCDDAL